MAAIPDWMREEERVRALLGDQANLTPASQGGANPYAPTGAAEPRIDPNTGDFIDTYGYFDQGNVRAITDYSTAMQEALQRGDNQGYQAALDQYRQTTGGLQPVWSYNITPESVAANAPHANDPYNVAWNARQGMPGAQGPVNPDFVSATPRPGPTPTSEPPWRRRATQTPAGMTQAPGAQSPDGPPQPPVTPRPGPFRAYLPEGQPVGGSAAPVANRGADQTTSGGYAIRPPNAGLGMPPGPGRQAASPGASGMSMRANPGLPTADWRNLGQEAARPQTNTPTAASPVQRTVNPALLDRTPTNPALWERPAGEVEGRQTTGTRSGLQPPTGGHGGEPSIAADPRRQAAIQQSQAQAADPALQAEIARERQASIDRGESQTAFAQGGRTDQSRGPDPRGDGYGIRPPNAGLTGGNLPGPGGRTDGSRGPDPNGGSRVPPGATAPITGTIPPGGTTVPPRTDGGRGPDPTGGSRVPPSGDLWSTDWRNQGQIPPGTGGQTPQPGGTNTPGTPGGGGLPIYTGGGGGVPNPTGGVGGNAALPGYGAPYRPPGFDPNQGLDPLYYGYQIGAAGNPSLSYIPDLTTNDPNRLFRNVQNIGYNYGAGNAAEIGSHLSEQERLYGGYGNAANEAFARLNETPGYTTDEAGNIIREGEYRAAMTTPGEYASLDPTASETSGMMGNTASYQDYYDPQRFNDINQGNRNMQYANIDRVQGGQDSALGGLSHAYDTSIDPNRLRIDPEYARQAGMTDAEVEQMVNAAHRNIGLTTQSQVQDMERRAAAAGTTSPLAMGALRSRMQQQGQVNAADAGVNARLAARRDQRGAATGVEQTRLDAERGLTGYQTAAARDLANQQIGAQQFTGQLTRGALDQMAGNELNSQQYLTGTGIALRKAQDEANAARAAQQYGIRQGNTQYGQQSRYNQGMGTAGALSNSYANVAQQRLAGQGQYRGYLTGQQTQALGAGQTARGQNLQNYNAMTGGLNSNAAAWSNYQIGQRSLPAGWQQILAGIAGGGGAGTQQPQQPRQQAYF